MEKGKVSKLRPTQITVGFAEAEAKKRELAGLSSKKLDDYLKARAIPCVRGPQDKLYLVDHHHLGLALTQLGHEACYYEVVHDLSTVPEVKFFKVMEVLELVHLRGADGEMLPLYRVPKHLSELTDDPYRSLAGFVRGRGGYAKVPVPYSEFQWADFFRTRVAVGADFEPAIVQALALAASAEAAHLPGFLG